MRKLGLMMLLIAASACSASNSTAPSTVISIKLLDDAGAPAGRNRVAVTLADGTLEFASTGNHGTVDIPVPSAGSYVVSVIARTGFVGDNPNLTRSVTVAENARTEVEFVLYRGGVSSAEPFPEPPGH
jgi:hypothetical protein